MNSNSITVKEARDKAMQLCSRKEYSSREIRDKIISWGCSFEDTQQIVEYLVDQKFIDDCRYTEAYVNDKLRFNKWGRIKIAYMLRMQGVEEVVVRNVLSGIDENVYKQLLKDELSKKKKSIKASTVGDMNGKIFRFAAGRGFESELINQTIRELG